MVKTNNFEENKAVIEEITGSSNWYVVDTNTGGEILIHEDLVYFSENTDISLEKSNLETIRDFLKDSPEIIDNLKSYIKPSKSYDKLEDYLEEEGLEYLESEESKGFVIIENAGNNEVNLCFVDRAGDKKLSTGIGLESLKSIENLN